MSESRLVLSNGRSPRSKGGDYITKADAESMCVRVAEFYMAQLPGLVANTLVQLGVVTACEHSMVGDCPQCAEAKASGEPGPASDVGPVDFDLPAGPP